MVQVNSQIRKLGERIFPQLSYEQREALHQDLIDVLDAVLHAVDESYKKGFEDGRNWDAKQETTV